MNTLKLSRLALRKSSKLRQTRLTLVFVRSSEERCVRLKEKLGLKNRLKQRCGMRFVDSSLTRVKSLPPSSALSSWKSMVCTKRAGITKVLSVDSFSSCTMSSMLS